MRSPLPHGCLSLLLFFVLLLLPLFLADALLAALDKLGLNPGLALLAVMGIFLGGLLNIPVKRLVREQPTEMMFPSLFGLQRFIYRQTYVRQYTVIAVNVGGCLIPCFIASYELIRISNHDANALILALLAIVVNVGVCFWLARPVPNVGIALPTLVPGVVAALSALLLIPSFAPPVAFAAGVLGPLVGADLLHLRDIQKISTGMASIGGAGTFDGIVISGLIAALLS
jgi:uncharacterized membrane protein